MSFLEEHDREVLELLDRARARVDRVIDEHDDFCLCERCKQFLELATMLMEARDTIIRPRRRAA